MRHTKLDAYAACLKSRGTLQSWKERLGNWPIYAMATGSALALVSSAEASTINYSGIQNLTVAIPETAPGTHTEALNIFMTGGTKPNFKISIFNNLPATSSLRTQIVSMRGVHGKVGDTSGNAVRVPTYFHIDAAKPFGAGKFRMAKSSRSTGGSVKGAGFWFVNTGVPGFAPVKLSNGDLGWIHIVFNAPPNGFVDSITVIDWAYDTVPGQTILAGDTGIPEPGSGSMALLAAGAAGIVALRRRKLAAGKA